MDMDYLKSFFFEPEAAASTSTPGDIENQASAQHRRREQAKSRPQQPSGGSSTSAVAPNDSIEGSDSRKGRESPLLVTFTMGVNRITERIKGTIKKEDQQPGLTFAKSGESEDKSETESDTSGSSAEEAARKKKERKHRDERRRQSGAAARGRSRTRKVYSRQELDEVDKEKHLELLSHGRFWTIIGIIFTWIGFACSYLTRESSQFVSLDSPLYIDPVFEEVTEIGMINLRLCYNETHVQMKGCTIHELSSEDVNDSMFEVSRSVAFLAILVGAFMSIFLTSAVYWHSINLRPVGLGYLLAYFLQSFTFLFFDTNICNEHDCHLSTGAHFSIFASLSWIVACIAASRMDAFKYHQKRLRRRERSMSRSLSPRKKPRSSSRSASPQKKSRLGRGVSDTTANTNGTEGSNRATGPPPTLVIEGIQDFEAAEAWIARREKLRPEPLMIPGGNGEMGYERVLSPPNMASPRGRSSTRNVVSPSRIASPGRVISPNGKPSSRRMPLPAAVTSPRNVVSPQKSASSRGSARQVISPNSAFSPRSPRQSVSPSRRSERKSKGFFKDDKKPPPTSMNFEKTRNSRSERSLGSVDHQSIGSKSSSQKKKSSRRSSRSASRGRSTRRSSSKTPSDRRSTSRHRSTSRSNQHSSTKHRSRSRSTQRSNLQIVTGPNVQIDYSGRSNRSIAIDTTSERSNRSNVDLSGRSSRSVRSGADHSGRSSKSVRSGSDGPGMSARITQVASTSTPTNAERPSRSQRSSSTPRHRSRSRSVQRSSAKVSSSAAAAVAAAKTSASPSNTESRARAAVSPNGSARSYVMARASISPSKRTRNLPVRNTPTFEL